MDRGDSAPLPGHRGIVGFEIERRADLEPDVLWYTVCIGLWPSVGSALGRDLDVYDTEEFAPDDLGTVGRVIREFMAAMPQDAVLKTTWADQTVTALAADVTEQLQRILELLEEAAALGSSVVVSL